MYAFVQPDNLTDAYNVSLTKHFSAPGVAVKNVHILQHCSTYTKYKNILRLDTPFQNQIWYFANVET